MATFKSVPTIATKRDIFKPINRRPDNTISDEDLEIKEPLTDEEADLALKDSLETLIKEEPNKEAVAEVEPDEREAEILGEPKTKKKPEAKPEKKVEASKEEPKTEKKPTPKPKKVEVKPVKIEDPKPEKKVEAPKEEPKSVEPTAKPEVKEEPVVEAKPAEEARPLTPEEKKAKQLENLRRAREAAQARKEREAEIMAAKTTGEKKPVVKPKKTVDMSKMMTVTKKPTAASGKTCYHVSKRGETAQDRVWKVFIQESNKVIKLFDTQAEALEYAKQLAKNKADGSYVILHGLDGKIRKY